MGSTTAVTLTPGRWASHTPAHSQLPTCGRARMAPGPMRSASEMWSYLSKVNPASTSVGDAPASRAQST